MWDLPLVQFLVFKHSGTVGSESDLSKRIRIRAAFLNADPCGFGSEKLFVIRIFWLPLSTYMSIYPTVRREVFGGVRRGQGRAVGMYSGTGQPVS